MKNNDRITEQITSTPQTHKSKVGNYIAYVALILVVIMMGMILKWSFQSDDVLEIKNEPVPARTIREYPEADGVVVLKVDYCKKIAVKGEVRVSFVGISRETFLPTAEDKMPANCNNGHDEPIEIPILIPKDLPVGHYHIHFNVVYQVNPLKEVVEEFDSQEFELVGSDDGNKSVEGAPEM